MMTERDEITYGRTARLRLALAGQAAWITDAARSLVPAYADEVVGRGDFVQLARRIAASTQDLLALAVACERQRGATWEVIGEALGMPADEARDLYEPAARQIEDELTESWLLEEDPAVRRPAESAEQLDRWVDDHLAPADALARRRQSEPGNPGYTHPVSAHLPPMDTWEHAAMIADAARIVSAQRDRRGPGDPRARRLELGYARRKVDLYERMLAEETVAPGGDGQAGKLRELLEQARGQLARLERGGPS